MSVLYFTNLNRFSSFFFFFIFFWSISLLFWVWLPFDSVIHLLNLTLSSLCNPLDSPTPLNLCDGSHFYLSVTANSDLPNLTGVSNLLSTYVVSGRPGQVALAALQTQGACAPQRLSVKDTVFMYARVCVCVCARVCICKCASAAEHVCIFKYARCGLMPHTPRDTAAHSCWAVNHDPYNAMLLSRHDKPLCIHCKISFFKILLAESWNHSFSHFNIYSLNNVF